MSIAIVGAGAIGCLFGLRLHKSGHRVILVQHRKSALARIKRHGVALTETSGKIAKARIEAKAFLSEKDDVDLVILAVKAYATENAARNLERITNLRGPVLSLQNGLGNVEILSQHLPLDIVLASTTTEGALAIGPGRIIHTGKGTTWIGEVEGKPTTRLSNIRTIFRDAGFNTEMSANIKGTIWSKAIVNCAINPVSALARVPNRQLLKIPELKSIADEVILEGITIARAQGINLSPSPRHLLHRVLSSTSANKSSMLQDIEAGKRTEVHQLNGWVSAVARRLRLRSPYNDLLTGLIIALESSRRNV